MDHAEAVTKAAVERYRLGELSGQEMDEFEAHFFQCAHCAEELRVAAIFEENAKAVFLENSRGEAGARVPHTNYERAPVSWWALFWRNPWSAVPAGVAAALMCVAAGQARMIQVALAPQAVASISLLTFARGEDHVLKVPKQYNFYSIYMDPAWPGTYPEYICTVRDEKKVIRISQHIPAPGTDESLQFLIPRSTLPSGRYTAILSHPAANGKPESELASYSFILKLE
jgi:hypothetical protein